MPTLNRAVGSLITELVGVLVYPEYKLQIFSPTHGSSLGSVSFTEWFCGGHIPLSIFVSIVCLGVIAKKSLPRAMEATFIFFLVVF